MTATKEEPLPEPLPENLQKIAWEMEAAANLTKRVRILCLVLASPRDLKNKCPHVKATWGKRCNKLLFMSSKEGTNVTYSIKVISTNIPIDEKCLRIV